MPAWRAKSNFTFDTNVTSFGGTSPSYSLIYGTVFVRNFEVGINPMAFDTHPITSPEPTLPMHHTYV